MVDVLGWLDGLTATGIILSATIFGLLSFYRANKLGAKLLAWAGLTMFFVGFLWLGPFLDFIMVVFFHTNITPIYLYAILSYLWVAPALVVAMYLGGSLMFPKKKWIIVGIFVVLGLVFEYFLWFQTSESFTLTLINPGEDLIDASFVRTHPTFLMVALFLVATLILLGIGFFIKAKQATGDLRKKFIYLGLGFTIFVVCGALDSIVPPGIAIGFVRGVMMTFALWMYLGLKT
jgi:hypothetical protein